MFLNYFLHKNTTHQCDTVLYDASGSTDQGRPARDLSRRGKHLPWSPPSPLGARAPWSGTFRRARRGGRRPGAPRRSWAAQRATVTRARRATRATADTPASPRRPRLARAARAARPSATIAKLCPPLQSAPVQLRCQTVRACRSSNPWVNLED